jgi:hypothetical protein
MAVTSLPAIVQDLPDTLFGDPKDFSHSGYRLTILVSCADFSIAFAFGGRTIRNGELREFEAAIRDRHRERHGEQHLGE